MSSTLKLTGIALPREHLLAFSPEHHHVAWVECRTEDYLAEGSDYFQRLVLLREHCPISLHGRSLSLGSVDELNWSYLKKLADLIQRIDPCLVSDHLSWSSYNGQYFHECLPLLLTEETLRHINDRIDQVQCFLKRQILIENIANDISFPHTITEANFLSEVCKKTGCGVLLNINNLYQSAKQLSFDPSHYLSSLYLPAVKEVHVADIFNQQDILSLYQSVIKQGGIKPTIITIESHLTDLYHALHSAKYAESIMRNIYATIKHAS